MNRCASFLSSTACVLMALAGAGSSVAASAGASVSDAARPRIIITSDFPPFDVIPGGVGRGPAEKLSDPDEIQSIVLFLLYTNDLEVQGLIAFSRDVPTRGGRSQGECRAAEATSVVYES